TAIMRLLVVFLLLAASALAQAPRPFLPLDAKSASAYDRTWRRLAARDPNSGARTVYEFLLDAVAHDWHPERWAPLVALGQELQDRDRTSATYGNYRWYWREPKPNDRNCVEFAMHAASLAWVAYGDRMPPEARDALAAAFPLAGEGMQRHKVDVSYTNIFLMRLANCALLGEATHRPELVRQAETWFDEW